MPWPLHFQVPAAAFAMASSSAGGFISAILSPPILSPPALGSAIFGSAAFGAIFGSAALGSAFVGAATRPVIPISAMATRENVFIWLLLFKTGALYSNARWRHWL